MHLSRRKIRIDQENLACDSLKAHRNQFVPSQYFITTFQCELDWPELATKEFLAENSARAIIGGIP